MRRQRQQHITRRVLVHDISLSSIPYTRSDTCFAVLSHSGLMLFIDRNFGLPDLSTAHDSKAMRRELSVSLCCWNCPKPAAIGVKLRRSMFLLLQTILLPVSSTAILTFAVRILSRLPACMLCVSYYWRAKEIKYLLCRLQSMQVNTKANSNLRGCCFTLLTMSRLPSDISLASHRRIIVLIMTHSSLPAVHLCPLACSARDPRLNYCREDCLH